MSKNFENNLFYIYHPELKLCLFYLNMIRQDIIIDKKFDLGGCLNLIMNMPLNKEYKQIFFKNYFLPVIINDVCILNNCNSLISNDLTRLKEFLIVIETSNAEENFFNPNNFRYLDALGRTLKDLQKDNSKFTIVGPEPINPFKIFEFSDFLFKK